MYKQAFVVGKESLVGEIFSTGSNIQPQILVLHGAGQATKDRAKRLIEEVTDRTDQSALLFDFSGHGESTGELSQSSLKKRVDEANAAWQLLNKDKPLTVFGFSMGGHIALELLKHHDIANLILFYPGVYTHEAYDVPFDERFSNIIRQRNSWQQARVLENLKEFQGNLLIVWGENDVVIPREVVESIYESATNAKSRELIVIPQGEHLLLPRIYADQKLLDELVRQISLLFR